MESIYHKKPTHRKVTYEKAGVKELSKTVREQNPDLHKKTARAAAEHIADELGASEVQNLGKNRLKRKAAVLGAATVGTAVGAALLNHAIAESPSFKAVEQRMEINEPADESNESEGRVHISVTSSPPDAQPITVHVEHGEGNTE